MLSCRSIRNPAAWARQLGVLGALFVLASALPAQTPTPLGEPMVVNTTTVSYQLDADGVALPDGGFLVVWQSESSDGDDQFGRSIQGQRFASDGTPAGDEMQLNSVTTGDQAEPSVAVAGDRILVVWTGPDGSVGDFGDDFGIFARLFDLDVNPIGGDFQVNTFTERYQRIPSVAAVGDRGDFQVVWQSSVAPSNLEIRGRRISASGSPVGSELPVNTTSTGSQREPRIASASDGGFTVAWDGPGAQSTGREIIGRRFDAASNPLGGEFRVNSDTTGEQASAAIATAPSGDFVVAWNRFGETPPSGAEILARRFAADGTPLGDDVEVPTVNDPGHSSVALSSGKSEDFLVSWVLRNAAFTVSSLRGQRLGADGARLGEEFVIRSDEDSETAGGPVLVRTVGDTFQVVWVERAIAGPDTDETAILKRPYALPLFFDGFESGDTSAWSSAGE